MDDDDGWETTEIETAGGVAIAASASASTSEWETVDSGTLMSVDPNDEWETTEIEDAGAVVGGAVAAAAPTVAKRAAPPLANPAAKKVRHDPQSAAVGQGKSESGGANGGGSVAASPATSGAPSPAAAAAQSPPTAATSPRPPSVGAATVVPSRSAVRTPLPHVEWAKGDAERKLRVGLWTALAKRDIPKAHRGMEAGRKVIRKNALMAASTCVKEIRRRGQESRRTAKETLSRAKKMMREMLSFWRQDEGGGGRKGPRPRQLGGRGNDAREAERQDRKLNFLITQTELYAHFMKKKSQAPGADFEGEQKQILNKLNSAEGINIRGADSVEGLREAALREANAAVGRAQKASRAFSGGAAAQGTPTLQQQLDQGPSLADAGPVDDAVVAPSIFRGQLKTYQLAGMRWLVSLFDQGINGILADEMGLGKTVQSIVTLAHLAERENCWGPFLIVAPSSTLHNWEQEFRKFVPALKVIPYWGNQQQRKILRREWRGKNLGQRESPFHVVITSYQMAVTDEEHFNILNWQYMVLDEAQALKSHLSIRWKTLLGFRCRNRLLLTGTPVQNTMAELWALLHFIMPSLFDSHGEFNEWFSKDIENKAANKAATLNSEQLSRLHLILKPFMLRRVKKDVEKNLSDKIEIEVACALTARQQQLYDKIKSSISIDDIVGTLSSSGKSDMQSALMNIVIQLRKVCNHPDLFHRRSARLPFTMEQPRWLLRVDRASPSASAAGETSKSQAIPRVGVLAAPEIEFSCPRLVFHEVVVPRWDYRSVGHIPWLCRSRGIFTPAYIHRSAHPDAPDGATVDNARGCFSFLRLMDVTAGYVAAVAGAHLTERALLQLLVAAHATVWSHGAEDCARAEVAVGDGVHVSGAVDARGGREGRAWGEEHGAVRWRDTARMLQVWRSKVCFDSDLHLATSQAARAVRFGTARAIAPPIRATVSTWRQRCEGLALGSGMGWDAALSCMYPPGFQTGYYRGLGRETACAVAAAPSLCPRSHGGGAAAAVLRSLHPHPAGTFIDHPKKSEILTHCDKLQRLDLLLAKLKAEGHRVLIYSQMTRMLDLLEEYMRFRRFGHIRLDGSSKMSDRRDMVSDFQNRSDIFAFLLSTRAGGLGLNLTAADTVIFYDSDWNPTVDQQAMDRAHRLGQTKQVTVYRMVTKDTVEERILERAQQKSDIQTMVMTGGSPADLMAELKGSEVASLLIDKDVADEIKRRRAGLEAQREAEAAQKHAKHLERRRLLAAEKRAKALSPTQPTAGSRPDGVTRTPDGVKRARPGGDADAGRPAGVGGAGQPKRARPDLST